MRLDLTPYRRSTVGFDRLFDLLESNARGVISDNYPPFNLERIAEDRYRITLAVAGFSRDDRDHREAESASCLGQEERCHVGGAAA